jgi:hypothetical protein
MNNNLEPGIPTLNKYVKFADILDNKLDQTITNRTHDGSLSPLVDQRSSHYTFKDVGIRLRVYINRVPLDSDTLIAKEV